MYNIDYVCYIYFMLYIHKNHLHGRCIFQSFSDRSELILMLPD